MTILRAIQSDAFHISKHHGDVSRDYHFTIIAAQCCTGKSLLVSTSSSKLRATLHNQQSAECRSAVVHNPSTKKAEPVKSPNSDAGVLSAPSAARSSLHPSASILI